MRYRIEHGIEMFDQFVVSKALDAESIASKKIRALFVSGHVRCSAVLASVEFNDEFRLEANEVYNIRADRLLPPELRFCKSAVAKRLPQLAFDVGLIATQLACKFALHLFPLTSKI
jgi:hypothetical protein